MKDHEIRELVNQLRDIAIKYHGTGQLRERIAHVVRAAMLQELQKSAGASNNCRSNEKVQDLQASTFRENGNSSTNNCREIAETSTGTAITPAAPDKKLTDDVLDEIIAWAKTSMEQYLALSLKAEREVWRKEGPTDDERIMAIEGIHNCERRGDEGWVVGEMGITRCSCSQAGNSPAIPDCWCRTCRPITLGDMRFVVCPDCGNKRCPRANNHANDCSGSNEPGQEGSAYPAAPREVK